MLNEHNTKVSYGIGVKLAEHLQEVLKNKIRDMCSEQHQQAARAEYLRWLDWIFWGWYLPRLRINYVGMSKDMEKRLPNFII